MLDHPYAEKRRPDSLLAKLNYEVLKERSRADAHRAAVRGLLAAKGAPEDTLDEAIERGAASMLNLRLNAIEDQSPSAAALIDERSAEELDKVQYDILEEIRRRLGGEGNG